MTRRYLLIARHDRDHWPLVGEAARLLTDGPASFQILVTAPIAHASGDPHRAQESAGLLAALERAISQLGADVDGQVGDERVSTAIEQALRGDNTFDAVVIASPRAGVRHDLDLDLGAHIRRTFGMEVIEAAEAPPHEDEI